MNNPFYNGNMGGVPSFVQFMNSMKGKNPNDILNNLVNSGKVNQQQLNIAQQRAKQMSGAFDCFKSMFGFR